MLHQSQSCMWGLVSARRPLSQKRDVQSLPLAMISQLVESCFRAGDPLLPALSGVFREDSRFVIGVCVVRTLQSHPGRTSEMSHPGRRVMTPMMMLVMLSEIGYVLAGGL